MFNHWSILIILLFTKQCLTTFTNLNKYNDYRLYSVQMPNNYDLIKPVDDLLINNENDKKNIKNEDNSNDLFFGLMNQLINQAPMIDLWNLGK